MTEGLYGDLLREEFPIFLTRFHAMVIVAQMQLALRHPENKGPSSEDARAIARHLITAARLWQLVPAEAFQEWAAELGWKEPELVQP